MDSASTHDVALRDGDWGPGYALRGPRTLIGVCHFRPGDEMGNHYHAHHEESFLILEGEVTVWMNCREKYILREGDLHRCDPNEMHYLRNDATRLGRLLFIKAPAVPEDRIDVPWLPGEPEPQVAPQTSA